MVGHAAFGSRFVREPLRWVIELSAADFRGRDEALQKIARIPRLAIGDEVRGLAGLVVQMLTGCAIACRSWSANI